MACEQAWDDLPGCSEIRRGMHQSMSVQEQSAEAARLKAEEARRLDLQIAADTELARQLEHDQAEGIRRLEREKAERVQLLELEKAERDRLWPIPNQLRQLQKELEEKAGKGDLESDEDLEKRIAEREEALAVLRSRPNKQAPMLTHGADTTISTDAQEEIVDARYIGRWKSLYNTKAEFEKARKAQRQAEQEASDLRESQNHDEDGNPSAPIPGQEPYQHDASCCRSLRKPRRSAAQEAKADQETARAMKAFRSITDDELQKRDKDGDMEMLGGNDPDKTSPQRKGFLKPIGASPFSSQLLPRHPEILQVWNNLVRRLDPVGMEAFIPKRRQALRLAFMKIHSIIDKVFSEREGLWNDEFAKKFLEDWAYVCLEFERTFATVILDIQDELSCWESLLNQYIKQHGQTTGFLEEMLSRLEEMVEMLWTPYHFDEATGNTYEQSLDEDLGVYKTMAVEADREAASHFNLILKIQPKWEYGTQDMWPLLPVLPALPPMPHWMEVQVRGFEDFTDLSFSDYGV